MIRYSVDKRIQAGRQSKHEKDKLAGHLNLNRIPRIARFISAFPSLLCSHIPLMPLYALYYIVV